MNCFIIECPPTEVPIKKAEIIVFSKFCYRQLFGKSGWSLKKMVVSLQNVAVACKYMITSCVPNFSLIGQQLPELSHNFTFGWVGPFGQSACTDFFETQATYPKILPCKKSRGSLKAFSRNSIFWHL